MIIVASVFLGAAGLCFAARLIRGPSLSDRVMGLDGIVIIGIAAVALRAMSTGTGAFLPVLVVVTLVGFVSTSASARFIEGHANMPPEDMPPEDTSGRRDDTEPSPGSAEEPGEESPR